MPDIDCEPLEVMVAVLLFPPALSLRRLIPRSEGDVLHRRRAIYGGERSPVPGTGARARSERDAAGRDDGLVGSAVDVRFVPGPTGSAQDADAADYRDVLAAAPTLVADVRARLQFAVEVALSLIGCRAGGELQHSCGRYVLGACVVDDRCGGVGLSAALNHDRAGMGSGAGRDRLAGALDARGSEPTADDQRVGPRTVDEHRLRPGRLAAAKEVDVAAHRIEQDAAAIGCSDILRAGGFDEDVARAIVRELHTPPVDSRSGGSNVLYASAVIDSGDQPTIRAHDPDAAGRDRLPVCGVDRGQVVTTVDTSGAVLEQDVPGDMDHLPASQSTRCVQGCLPGSRTSRRDQKSYSRGIQNRYRRCSVRRRDGLKTVRDLNPNARTRRVDELHTVLRGDGLIAQSIHRNVGAIGCAGIEYDIASRQGHGAGIRGTFTHDNTCSIVAADPKCSRTGSTGCKSNVVSIADINGCERA